MEEDKILIIQLKRQILALEEEVERKNSIIRQGMAADLDKEEELIRVSNDAGQEAIRETD